MSAKLFLFNRDIIELDETSDPRRDPAFPLTQEQYDVLTVEGLIQLLQEEFMADPNIAQSNFNKLRMLCALLSQIGKVNCVKLQVNGHEVYSRHGFVREHLLLSYRDMQQVRQPTDSEADDLIWSHLSAA